MRMKTWVMSLAMAAGATLAADDPMYGFSRTISCSFDGRNANLAFSENCSVKQRLYVAWGMSDGGDATNGWAHVDRLADVETAETQRTVTVPGEASYVRFFVQPLIPDGYAVEYLQSSGADEYVSTGFTPNQKSRARLRCETLAASTTYVWPMGARNGDTKQFGILCGVSNDRWVGRYETKTLNFDASKPNYLGSHVFDLNRNAYKLDDWTKTFVSKTFTCPGPLYVFAVNNNGTASMFTPMKFYSMGIWDDGKLARNFIPVVKSDGTTGLYDAVNGGFAAGQGATALTAGAEVWRKTDTVVLEALSAVRTISYGKILPNEVTVRFSSGLKQRLYFAWSETVAGGDTTNGWAHVERLADVREDETERIVAVDAKASCFRIFMQPLVPGGRAVESLRSSGTDEFIDTGFTADQNTRADYSFYLDTSQATTFVSPMGARGEGNNASVKQFFVGAALGKSASRWFRRYGSQTNKEGENGKPDAAGSHTFSLNKNEFTLDSQPTDVMDVQTFTCMCPLYVFAVDNCGAAAMFAKMSLYSLALWDNGSLRRNYVPALDDSGRPCLYDAVNDNFTYGSGTTALTAGDEVWRKTDTFGIASAEWTNAAGDNARTNPANWACINYKGEAATGALPICLTDISLAADASWDTIADYESTIDLNGYNLTVPELSGSATVTNSSAIIVSELRVNVASGRTTENRTVVLKGNLALVKEGEGTFVAKKKGQSYLRGTEVADGTFQIGAGDVLGGTDNPVTVGAGATFDVNGYYELTGYDFVLAGGTFANTRAIDNVTGKAQIKGLTLTADSYLHIAQDYGLLNSGHNPTVLDLGGHTLTANMENGKSFILDNATVTNGTLVVCGGYFYPYKSENDVVFKDATLVSRSAFRVDSKTLQLDNYTSEYDGNYGRSSSKLTVKGVFKPVHDYFSGCKLLDGATLDLSTRTGTWTARSLITAGDSQDVRFEDGATITVDLTGRTPANGDKIVAWNTAPVNLATLKFKLSDGSSGKLIVKDDGIYFHRAGLLLIIR